MVKQVQSTSNKRNSNNGNQKPKTRTEQTKAGRRSRTGGKHAGENGNTTAIKAAKAVTLGKSDLLAGDVRPGHYLILGDATFEMQPRGLLTLVKGAGGLAKFTDVNENVFVTLSQCTNDEFESSLSGDRRQKQEAMWQHIREILEEDGIEKLHAMISARMTQANRFADDEHYDRFQDSVPVSAEMLNGLEDDNMVQVRFASNGAADALVIGIHYEQRDTRSRLVVEAGFVGNKHPLKGKILQGTKLFCGKGMLPDAITIHEDNKSLLLLSANELLNFIAFSVDSIEKQLLIDAMHNACKRIHNAHKHSNNVYDFRPAVKASQFGIGKKPHHDTTPGEVNKMTSVEAPPVAVAPQPAATANDGLNAYIATLRESGLDGAELAKAVSAYVSASPKQKTANS